MTVQAQVDPEQSEADFRKEVHKTLRDFIPGDWRIQNMNRSKGNQFETVSVTATVRVPDKENYQLEARAAKVSRIGFELYYPRPEYELTFDQIQAVNAELRLDLIQKALTECKNYNSAFKDSGFKDQKFRISSSRFDNGSNVASTSNARGVFMAQAASAPGFVLSSAGGNASSYQPESHTDDGDEGAEEMGVIARFSMTGTFVLRAVHNA